MRAVDDRQTSIQPPAQGCSLTQNFAGAVCLGGGTKVKQLPASPILPHQSPARPQEGDHGRRRLIAPWRDSRRAWLANAGLFWRSCRLTRKAVGGEKKN